MIVVMLPFCFAASPIQAAEDWLRIRGENATGADIVTLPPVCKLIMIERPGIHGPVGQGDHPELFERPEYRLAKGNIHLHHYCWALISKQRYFRASSAGQRNYYFSQFMGDIDYVIKNSSESWPYFYVMYIEQGSMLLIRGDYPASLAKADMALKQKPGEETAYALKFDIYMAMGDKKKAIESAQEGLKANPASKRLRKRLLQAGVKLQPQEPVVDVAKPSDTPPTDTTNGTEAVQDESIAQPNASESVKNASDQDLAPTATHDPAANTGTNSSASPDAGTKQEAGFISHPPDNPYCRFCP